MPTFGTWERVVLERCFDLVDHISAHAYYEPVDGDVDSFLACAEDMDRFIRAVVATADHVAAVKGSDKRISVSFDEWNVWFQERFHGESSLDIREAPELIEDVYAVTDAVVVGSLLITLMQHTDRVSMACQAQLVNVIAPIATRPGGAAWRQTIFHPFALTAAVCRRHRAAPGGRRPTRSRPRPTGAVDQLLVTATLDEETGELVVFAVNRSRTEDCELTLDLDALAHSAGARTAGRRGQAAYAAVVGGAPDPARRRPERPQHRGRSGPRPAARRRRRTRRQHPACRPPAHLVALHPPHRREQLMTHHTRTPSPADASSPEPSASAARSPSVPAAAARRSPRPGPRGNRRRGSHRLRRPQGRPGLLERLHRR